jgi:hypothetical protein
VAIAEARRRAPPAITLSPGINGSPASRARQQGPGTRGPWYQGRVTRADAPRDGARHPGSRSQEPGIKGSESSAPATGLHGGTRSCRRGIHPAAGLRVLCGPHRPRLDLASYWPGCGIGRLDTWGNGEPVVPRTGRLVGKPVGSPLGNAVGNAMGSKVGSLVGSEVARLSAGLSAAWSAGAAASRRVNGGAQRKVRQYACAFSLPPAAAIRGPKFRTLHNL